MKKTVVLELTYEIDIADDLLTEEALEEFSESIFKVKTPKEIFAYVAIQISNHGNHFVEGIGVAVDTDQGNAPVKYELIDIHTDIL